jgi:predicted RND superfamily exporter protein
MSGMDENPEQEAEPEQTQERESKQRLEQLPQEKNYNRHERKKLALKTLFILSPMILFGLYTIAENCNFHNPFTFTTMTLLCILPTLLITATIYLFSSIYCKRGLYIAFITILLFFGIGGLFAFGLIGYLGVALSNYHPILPIYPTQWLISGIVFFALATILYIAVIIYFSIETVRKIKRIKVGYNNEKANEK